MSRQIQIRRGSATAHESFTGAIGEITMDTTNKTLRVHDGETVGGIKLAKQSEIPTVPDLSTADYVIESQSPTSENNYTWYRKYKSGWVEQGGQASGSNNGSVNVSLPITMADTNYSVLATNCFTGSPSAPQTAYTVRAQKNNSTVSSVNFIATWCSSSQIGYSEREFCWQVSGMAA